MAEFISTNSGLLRPDMVKTGDKLILIDNAYSTFSEARQQTFWNVKVLLPNGTHKLAGLMDTFCEAFVDKWGKFTEDWTGHTVEVEVRKSKKDTDYIWLKPTDDPKVDVAAMEKEKAEKDAAKVAAMPPEPKVEYPSEEIKPEDIPFS